MEPQIKKFDVAKELAALRHEKKNLTMKSLPPAAKISRRPLNHPAVASPLAGSHVQKVLYVSCQTPFMSAVKRVKKLLQHIEKRAIQSVEANSQMMTELINVSDQLAKRSEVVTVKASGRAMTQALRIGEWFRSKENEYMCNVEVKAGNVAAIDDILTEEADSDSESAPDDQMENGNKTEQTETTLEGGDTTMDILGDQSDSMKEHNIPSSTENKQENDAQEVTTKQKRARRRRKRKREVYAKGDVPEARIRWVKTVEVLISLKA